MDNASSVSVIIHPPHFHHKRATIDYSVYNRSYMLYKIIIFNENTCRVLSYSIFMKFLALKADFNKHSFFFF